jgi:cell division protein FtsB
MKRFGFILFILIIIYFIFLIRQDIIDNLDLGRERERVAVELTRQRMQSKKLKERLRALGSNQYIEELARTRLGMIKKGETPYKVIDQGVK